MMMLFCSSFQALLTNLPHIGVAATAGTFTSSGSGAPAPGPGLAAGADENELTGDSPPAESYV